MAAHAAPGRRSLLGSGAGRRGNVNGKVTAAGGWLKVGGFVCAMAAVLSGKTARALQSAECEPCWGACVAMGALLGGQVG